MIRMAIPGRACPTEANRCEGMMGRLFELTSSGRLTVAAGEVSVRP